MAYPEWKILINQCFKSTEFMALATQGEKDLWVNPVYFSWDEQYNLYFISQLNCLHMNNIEDNAQVACTIFPTNRPAGDDVFGSYIKGEAEILQDEADIKNANTVYYSRIYPDKDIARIEDDSYKNDSSWHMVRVNVSAMWYFDTRYFDEVRVEVPRDVWS